MADRTTYADCTTEDGPTSGDEAELVQSAQPGQSMAVELRSWRKRLGLLPAQAAERVKVPVATWRGWEVGRPPALPDMLRELMRFIERDATTNDVTGSGPAATPVQPMPSSPATPSHNIPQTLSRPTVEPFFRSSGKGQSRAGEDTSS